MNYYNNMFDFKIIPVETTIECPNCWQVLKKGDTVYKDNDRGETICNHCLENYKKEVISEEGIDGRLLK